MILNDQPLPLSSSAVILTGTSRDQGFINETIVAEGFQKIVPSRIDSLKNGRELYFDHYSGLQVFLSHNSSPFLELNSLLSLLVRQGLQFLKNWLIQL